MANEGKLFGHKKPFPILGCKNENELTEKIYQTYIELKNRNDKAKLIHAFSQLEIGEDFDIGTIQIMDNRTKQILEMYAFNETCPNFYTRNELDNYVLFQSFREISKTKPRLF